MGGSFHIAPGKSFSLNHIHIHDVHPYSSTTFNTSHTITHLSFGERIHFANTHPLDNTPVYAKEGKKRERESTDSDVDLTGHLLFFQSFLLYKT